MEEIIAGLPPTDPERRLEWYRQALAELTFVAWRVVEETRRIHDGSPRPQKYRAPYGAITELSGVLTKQAGCR